MDLRWLLQVIDVLKSQGLTLNLKVTTITLHYKFKRSVSALKCQLIFRPAGQSLIQPFRLLLHAVLGEWLQFSGLDNFVYLYYI